MREPRNQRQVIANHCGRQAWSNHGKHRPCTDMSKGQTPTPPDSATSRPAPRGVCNCFHMESRPRKSKAELSFIGAATAGGGRGEPPPPLVALSRRQRRYLHTGKFSKQGKAQQAQTGELLRTAFRAGYGLKKFCSCLFRSLPASSLFSPRTL